MVTPIESGAERDPGWDPGDIAVVSMEVPETPLTFGRMEVEMRILVPWLESLELRLLCILCPGCLMVGRGGVPRTWNYWMRITA